MIYTQAEADRSGVTVDQGVREFAVRHGLVEGEHVGAGPGLFAVPDAALELGSGPSQELHPPRHEVEVDLGVVGGAVDPGVGAEAAGGPALRRSTPRIR